MPDRALRRTGSGALPGRAIRQKTPNARQGITTEGRQLLAVSGSLRQKTPNARQGPNN